MTIAIDGNVIDHLPIEDAMESNASKYRNPHEAHEYNAITQEDVIPDGVKTEIGNSVVSRAATDQFQDVDSTDTAAKSNMNQHPATKKNTSNWNSKNEDECTAISIAIKVKDEHDDKKFG
ncbi:uncharacterized protein ASCRUDRAFT_7355 [Ascoidea rubescens DSM 1968]|uniref:Uncharacterized protein n=1 Tax=Ascoidea rubescens DSM 1968 TaxID=1344418 RepID=A0A1D2VJX1_9ASCO|nr:hypothetical protein ASCRUDRAFT_7355 [Ascoidea rubescens DSM 1968]ODV61888.1 hypothetical protein ASCRUDRAFT_7355 [Ascoidea rubescens DSM 1968]